MDIADFQLSAASTTTVHNIVFENVIFVRYGLVITLRIISITAIDFYVFLK